MNDILTFDIISAEKSKETDQWKEFCFSFFFHFINNLFKFLIDHHYRYIGSENKIASHHFPTASSSFS